MVKPVEIVIPVKELVNTIVNSTVKGLQATGIANTEMPTITATLVPNEQRINWVSTWVAGQKYILKDGIYHFRYSYYDPRLGGVNCAEFDISKNECMSFMASGLDWRDYWGIAIACPLEYPIGTRIYVIKPELISRYYMCLDYCPACTVDNRYIDFLDTELRLPWRSEILAEVWFP